MKTSAVCPQMRLFASRLRQFSTQTGMAQAPIIFVKGGQSARPNSLLGPADKQFPFPGDVSHKSALEEVGSQPEMSILSDTRHSINSLVSANRVDADATYLNELRINALEEAQERAGDWPIELSLQECPRLLKKDLKFLFPDLKLDKVAVSVLNLTQKTENDMASWSKDMEEEREVLTASFVSSAQAICNSLRSCGYWADFVDPSSGRPFLGHYSNYALFETDDVYKYMGFNIEDLGCCKVLKHVAWGSHAFVGTLFTDAPMDSQIVKDILAKVNEED
ncbi:unnamed protein product [Auanema sp. JU1783]|nr:unnamed protein product [Auanema sp. JU1783]